jgi:hypothetical protein
MVIVDTTVWIDYLRGLRNRETDWFDDELPRRRFWLSDLILCEVLQGVRGGKAFSQVRRELREFELFTTSGIGGRGCSEFQDSPRAGPHRPQDHRLFDRDVLHCSWAFSVTSRSRLRPFRTALGIVCSSSVNLFLRLSSCTCGIPLCGLHAAATRRCACIQGSLSSSGRCET